MPFCTCSSDVLVPPPYAATCDTNFRRARNDHFLLVKCDFTTAANTPFAPSEDDALSPTFWQEAIEAGVAALSPAGNLVINQPDVTSFVTTGCGEEAVGDLTYTVDFTTYQAGLVNKESTLGTYGTVSDVDYWYNFFVHSGVYRVIFFLNGVRGSDENECHHSMYVSDDLYKATMADMAADTPTGVVPVLSNSLDPGLKFSVTSPPAFIEGDEGLGQWSMQFSITRGTPLGAVWADGVVDSMLTSSLATPSPGVLNPAGG